MRAAIHWSDVAGSSSTRRIQIKSVCQAALLATILCMSGCGSGSSSAAPSTRILGQWTADIPVQAASHIGKPLFEYTFKSDGTLAIRADALGYKGESEIEWRVRSKDGDRVVIDWLHGGVIQDQMTVTFIDDDTFVAKTSMGLETVYHRSIGR